MSIALLLYTLLGLLAGQLLVWLADRLPARRSLTDTLFCPSCGRENLSSGRWPVALGWQRCVVEGGRPRLRSLLIILGTAAGFTYLWLRYGPALMLLPLTLYWLIFVLVIVIDLEHRLILNIVILPAILLGIGGSFLMPKPDTLNALLGGAVGLMLVYGIYLAGALFARAMSRRRGKPIEEVAFGAGDVKLAAFIGLVTGLPGVIFALVIGILLGGIAALLYLLWEIIVRRRYVPFMAIPYGPFLAAGGLLILFYGEPIMKWYLAYYSTR